MITKLSSLLLAMFTLSACTQQIILERQKQSIEDYGPRWIDYDGWGKLEFGMSKQDVIQSLGEPYMPLEGLSQSQVKTQVLIFKIRVKYYPISEAVQAKKIMVGAGGTPYSTDVTVWKSKKPEKFANTNIWSNESYNLYCIFEDGKLARWRCPEAGVLQRAIVDSSLVPQK